MQAFQRRVQGISIAIQEVGRHSSDVLDPAAAVATRKRGWRLVRIATLSHSYDEADNIELTARRDPAPYSLMNMSTA
jgi:hypothetical protein